MDERYLRGTISLLLGTAAEWNNTTFPIPDGAICFETDTLRTKIGNGNDLYEDLSHALGIPAEQYMEILSNLNDENGLVVSDGANHIPVELFAPDILNHIVFVQNIEARNNLHINIIKNATMIFVADATGDPTVNAGMAFYASKFSDEDTYVWIKVGEQESIDFDLSPYLRIDMYDELSDGIVYVKLHRGELERLATAMLTSDYFIIEPNVSDSYFIMGLYVDTQTGQLVRNTDITEYDNRYTLIEEIDSLSTIYIDENRNLILNTPDDV